MDTIYRVEIRRLVPSDAPVYREIALKSLRLHPEAFTSTPEERGALPLTWWEGRLQPDDENPGRIFGAFEDGELVGMVGLIRETRERSRHKATLVGMYVDARFRNRGLGKDLVTTMLAEARSWDGLRIVNLTLTGGNASAQALYERTGFQVFGVEPKSIFLDGAFLDKVHMWLDLYPH